MSKPVPNNLERLIWPTYSWRAKSVNTQLFYIRDRRQADLAINNLCKGPLGFDLEWRPNYIKGQPENPVALVQLSSKNTILLIQICAMTKFPTKLRELLYDPNVVKAGVGIQHDCMKLYSDCKISVRNCVDLSLLARCVDNSRWKGRYVDPIGLSRLVETYENLSLPKGRIQRSNWEAELSEVQQDYAANDAHSALVIFNRFLAMARTMPSRPKSTYYSFDAVDGRLLNSSGIAWSPSNPEYDPGPPPSPKPPKPPRALKSTPAANGVAVKTSAVVSAPAVQPSRTRNPNDIDHRKTELGSARPFSSSSRRSYPPVDNGHAANSEQPRTRPSHRRARNRGGSGGHAHVTAALLK